MSEGLSIDLGSAIPYVVDRIQAVLGKDPGTVEFKKRVLSHSRKALEHASWIQCVGMRSPVPITSIYQPTHFASLSHQGGFGSIDDFLATGHSAVVFARPGCGKSTLLNW